MKYFFCLTVFILLKVNVFSQTQKDTTQLSEITLVKEAGTKYQNTAISVSQLSAADLQKNDGVIITSALNSIPGVYMQQGNLNTNRITIRGIGARSQFSTNRITTYFEDIPLTNAEGESVIEDIDVENLGGIEVLKGPNNSIYGSGLGGVILLKSKPIINNFVQNITQVGSFGLWRQNISVGVQNENNYLLTNYNHLQSDGFRDNSRYNRDAFNLSGSLALNEKSKLSFISVFTRLKAFIPSSLNETDFENNPQTAPANWAQSEGFESYKRLVLGINYKLNINARLNWSTSIFGNYKDAFEPRPFDILDEVNGALGLRSLLNYNTKLFNADTQLTVGTELMTEDYTFSLFRNLYQQQPGVGSVKGDQFAKTNQNRNYIRAFISQSTNINNTWFFEAGLSLNSTTYTQKDEFNSDTSSERESYSFETVLSPRLGISYKANPNTNIFGSVSRGFSVPSVAETLTPEGSINTELKPERGWNYEVGVKSTLLKNKLYTELTLYSLQVNNLLVARRIAEDQFVGINAGESSHKGAELSLRYNETLFNNIEVSPYFTGSLNHYRFKDFVDGDEDFSGNKLTGAPNVQWQTGLDINTDFGLSIFASLLHVGAIPLNDGNTLFSDAYSVTNLKAMYQFPLFKSIIANISAGVNNLFDLNYAASILPNAVGFGNSAPRYFYPGAPVNYFGNINLRYQF
ncbi:TonB-dependent receptor [Paucihalobacter ruber]|uniref:TonB-dependent receptor n=1 Tax=Paucihalobacter ruber TaxID=2567861 RepID=A0A506PK66_9FLAO|nr:TonB-dependent receptor [Paucihalobacter ruber]TPV33765.1 TonB-dependent receptor [Paucihalobacter ruber]